MNTIEWFSGVNKYKRHRLIVDSVNNTNYYSTELLDTPTNTYNNIYEIFYDHLSVRQTKYVDVLYSGGMDSELVLHTCLVNNIPVRALTMRLMIENVPINTHDLYHSIRYCTSKKIEQIIIDIDIKKFFESGDFLKYLDPYLITEPHVSTHMWLFEQCSGFPVLGGDYPWPWTNIGVNVISPSRLEFSQYDRYLVDKGIHGIGNMLGHSLDSILMLMKKHVEIVASNEDVGGDQVKIIKLKNILCKNLGFDDAELRMRSFGWEKLDPRLLNVMRYKIFLLSKYGKSIPKIIWNKRVADILSTTPGENDKFK